MIAWGSGVDLIRGNGGTWRGGGLQVDFPEIYRLCNAREVKGKFIRFCMCMAGDGDLCDAHEYMREAGKGQWDGVEVTFRQ